ncbi:MAG TPA: ribonuclease P protein component [Chitinophagaceae bacterium]
MPKQFTLRKKEKLKSRKQIEKLFAEGRSFVVNPFRIHFIVNGELSMVNSESSLQFGVGVSNRNFKRAVDRNRIKRLTREAWRLQKHELKESLKLRGKQVNVFFIYTGKELTDFTTVKEKVAVALKKLAGKIDENISSNT